MINILFIVTYHYSYRWTTAAGGDAFTASEPMARDYFASPTSRLSSAQRGAECRLPVFHTETQRNYQKQPGHYSPEKYPIYRKDCNPQPANCLKNQYVLRHCCVDDRSDKMLFR
ncbi:hypothetical protein KCP74_20725 [Salmonella enterica subsp. enterica]|nr:hypothetical protein KCP74_20725 [Salmonella enterica subsp. enterica]